MSRRFAFAVALLLSSIDLQAQEPTALDNILDLTHVITDSDPTTLSSIRYLGELDRHMWIVRNDRWVPGDYAAHVFDVAFDRRQVEFQVHAELGDRAAARAEVEVFAPIFGQLPRALLEHLREVEIHQTGGSPMSARRYNTGDPSAGSVSINTSAVADVRLVQRGFAEEYAIHEAAHVSWDPDHLSSPGWLEAQQADPAFISPYARDYPDREDLADTTVAWFAMRYRPDRVTPDQQQAILEAIPNRLAYLDRQHFDMSPYVRATPVPALPLPGVVLLTVLLLIAGSATRAVH